MGKIGDALRRGLGRNLLAARGRGSDQVKAGDVFRQRGGASVGETAVVMSVGLDGQQIPHVRYRLTFRRGRGLVFDGGARTLALRPFLRLYNERVASPKAAAVAAEIAGAQAISAD